jgi:hypothetical protein
MTDANLAHGAESAERSLADVSTDGFGQLQAVFGYGRESIRALRTVQSCCEGSSVSAQPVSARADLLRVFDRCLVALEEASRTDIRAAAGALEQSSHATYAVSTFLREFSGLVGASPRPLGPMLEVGLVEPLAPPVPGGITDPDQLRRIAEQIIEILRRYGHLVEDPEIDRMIDELERWLNDPETRRLTGAGFLAAFRRLLGPILRRLSGVLSPARMAALLEEIGALIRGAVALAGDLAIVLIDLLYFVLLIAAALGIGMAIGYGIGSITVGGQTIHDWIADFFYGIYDWFTDATDCEKIYDAWLQSQADARGLEASGATTDSQLSSLFKSIALLDRYMKKCVSDDRRHTYEQARIHLLDKIRNLLH